jgi:xylan 1,4-beta-xylosidase
MPPLRVTALIPAAVLCALAAQPAHAQDQATAPSARVIAADFSAARGLHSKVFKRCIGAGRANEGLRADWQQQLALVQTDIGFRYIRMHGLLNDDMGVYREDASGNPAYNWQYIDALYDHLLSAGLKPFVELAFMPADLASGTTTIFWWKGNVTPPKSYQKWADLVRNLVTHFRDRYGHDEVRTWYFEVWNEPDIKPFYTADLGEYLRLYRTTAEAVKSVSREYRVGGPASAIAYQFEEELLKYCAQNNVPIDFIATHSYGVREGYLDETGRRGTVLDPDRTAVRSRMLHSREIIRKSALPNLELHFTEWSSAYTPTDYIHDQYHQAAFILDKIKGAQESVDSMSYWVFTDIFEENGPRMTPFHGGFGLLNYQSIKKPAYFAYQFLSLLGKTELVSSGDSSWVTRDDDGGVQALFWNYTPVVPPEGLNDQVYYKGELPSKNTGPVTVRLSGIPRGVYLLQVYRTGYRVNDPYTTYLDLGAPSQLTGRQVEAIKALNSGAPSRTQIIQISDGRFTETFPMRENDVYLVALKKL